MCEYTLLGGQADVMYGIASPRGLEYLGLMGGSTSVGWEWLKGR